MRKIIFLFILSFFINQNCSAQNNSEINGNWNSLKQSFISKSEIVLQLTGKLQKSKKTDKTELAKTALNAKELKIECQKTVLNKDAVIKLKQKNNELNTYLVRLLVNLESDLKMKTNENVLNSMDQLQNVDNQIFIQIKKHNQICLDLNKKELIYEVITQKESTE